MLRLAKPISPSVTLRVLAALLDYPGEGLRAALPEMRAILQRERALPAARAAEVDALIARLEAGDGLDAEAEYASVFDCGRATSLHLFEHVHGDSRERGPAMIDLVRTYENAGLYLAPGELPDYLPVVMEYASTQPAPQARAFLGELTHLLNALHGALRHRRSAYACIPAALVELAGETVDAVPLEADAPLDDAWAEPAAFDGCPAGAKRRPGEPQPIHVFRGNARTGAAP